MLQGPGENAGVIDLGNGEAVAFKVESHNHPSAVEPFQGAATGVGGILRDVVAMGARPIALLDGLRFGEPDGHFWRAVAGIGHYGNCVGVPTVGGETVFDDAYADNCLVNAMCVGLLPSERVTRARATTPGLALVLFGATTGRDGIGGASVLASQELGDDAPEKRPSVQIGDPFTGKRLIEVSLELVERGLVESLQDCGAAGLASSLAEMARDGAGVDVHLDRVPLREDGMEPWEIMISESQERMVAAVRPEALEAVAEVIDRWELHWAEIGVVTDSGLLRAFHGDALEGEIRASFLTDECPRYEVERRARSSRLRGLVEVIDPRQVYEHYDQLVGSRTVRRPGLDAAVLRLTPSYRGLAVSLDGPPLGIRDPFRAGALATLEAARNVACAGGEPLGAHRLPELRQPGEARDRLGAGPGDRGHRPGGRGARHPRRVRQRLALQRDGRTRRSRPRRSSGVSGSWRTFGSVPRGWREGDVVLAATTPRGVRPAGRGRARLVPLASRAALLARPRRHDRGGCPLERHRRRRRRPRERVGDPRLRARRC